MRIEVTSHGAHIKAQGAINEEISIKLKNVHEAVRKLTDAPGNKAKKVLQTVGAVSLPVAGYGIFAFIKWLVGGAK
jgi:hypothetical protein